MVYQPLHIKEASEEAAARRAERRERMRRNYPETLDDEYRALFGRMGLIKPEQASGLSVCLEPEEKSLLCDYLFTEAASEAKETLSYVLLEDLDTGSSGAIYRKCLAAYDDEAFKPLFAKLKKHKGFLEAVEKLFGFRAEGLFEALSGGTVVDYLTTEAGDRGRGEKDGYLGALGRFGVTEDMKLYNECAKMYVVVCDAKQYKSMGVDRLMDITADFETDYKTRLLRNMLEQMDAYQLRGFVPMLDEFIGMTGEKGSADYNSRLGGLSEGCIDKYDIWTSQYKLREVLGEGEISTFWYGYVDKAVVLRLDKLDTVLISFENFVVIEIKDNDAAYFYDREYFNDRVQPGLTEAKSADELEKWLHDKTEWGASGDHTTHWRKAHTGRWQMAFKEYISKNR